MDKHAMWKWLLTIGLVSWSLVLVMPPFDVKDEEGRVVEKGKIRLGLDLQGGISFLMEVDTSAMEDADDRRNAPELALEVIRNRVDLMGTEEPIIYLEPNSNRIVVQIPGLDTANRDWAVRTLESAAYLEFRIVHEDNDRLTRRLFNEGLAPDGHRIVEVDDVLPTGRRIRGYFYMRDDVQRLDRHTEREAREQLRSFEAPPGYDFMLSRRDYQGQHIYEPYFVRRRPELTGELLSNARVDYQQFGQPIVELSFDGEGTARFREVTTDYAPGGIHNPNQDGQRFLAIVLDGVLHSAPFLRVPIYNGQAVIEGSFTLEEARELSLVLRAGSLPAPVRVIEERNVDPTLGRDSIQSGARAIMIGGVLVLLFMLGYYLFAGVVANLALILDILLLPLGMLIAAGFLGLFTGAGGGGTSLPTLTLPGIAGIVLTIGMAVDANVLIFERIREEQKVGKRLINAIEAGYDKAFSTILDANVTTLITAVILFWQGSGPIRGFAIMLSAGIIVSMFVALVVTRLMFEFTATKTSMKSIKMFSLVNDPNIQFLNKRKIAAMVSIALILVTWVMFFQRGQENFSVDFTGGTALTLDFEEKLSNEELRAALDGAGLQDTFMQYQRTVAIEDADFREYLLLKVPLENGEALKELLHTELAHAGFHILQEDSVGAQVGKDLRKKGIMAFVWALIGIVIYVSIRFEFAFAMGAIVAVAHDILITIGIFCLLGNQLSLPVIAALLTIVGYSVNDTIVVFDRIREDLGLIRDKTYTEIANLSINQTLSRTLLTSVTTLLTVTMLLVFGGGAIKDFALALFIGILVGTYSSIFIATPTMLLWHKDEKPKGAVKPIAAKA